MTAKQLDFDGLSAALLPRLRDLLEQWLPGGRMVGKEYVCAGREGGEGRSLSINTTTGAWAEFSGDAKGGDPASLYAWIKGLKNGEAAKELAKEIGFQIQTEPDPERPIAPPAGIEDPTMRHHEHGAPAGSWCYRNSEGAPLFYIARYNPKDGGRKQYAPWAWTNRNRWISKAWPEPRPMYGLELLAASREAPVLLVEGEKAADAARAISGPYAVVSWPGGAAAVGKVDWSPLSGRKVLIWPDADAPGIAAAQQIAAASMAAAVKIIDVTGMPDKWDAADAVAEGWDWARLLEWAKPRAKDWVAPAAPSQVIPPTSDKSEEPEDRADSSNYAEWDRLGIALTNTGSPIYNVDNAQRVLEGRTEFDELVWYDEFHKRFFTRFNFDTFRNEKLREWTDVDVLHLLLFMQRQLGLRRMSEDMVSKAVRIYAHNKRRNEPLDWMTSLKWDEVSRIETFFIDCFGAVDNEYARAVGRNFWIGMVARIIRPGCKLDNMIVLEGGQGAFKSTALEAIGAGWYTEVKESVQSNDFFMVLHGKLLCEIAELDSFGKADITRIKQVVTCKTDRYRAPYDRTAQDNPRMSIFVGSTNDTHYLRDNTGARRFWPIKCGTIVPSKIKEMRDQLFAEAVARLGRNETWWEMPAAAAIEQEARRQVDAWEDAIETCLVGRTETTMLEIAGHLKIEIGKLDMVTQRRISNVLRVLRWAKIDGATWARMDAEPALPVSLDPPFET